MTKVEVVWNDGSKEQLTFHNEKDALAWYGEHFGEFIGFEMRPEEESSR